MREIEIKLRVKDFKALEKKLRERNCILTEPISQRDVIYSLNNSRTEYETPKEGDVIIRIRNLKDKAEFTLKKQRSNQLDNFEYETDVSNPQAVHSMLTVLGWSPVVEVKKLRRKGKLGEFEICLDQVEKLGTFVEIEKIADEDADPKKVEQDLFTEAELLGLSKGDQEHNGYDVLIYNLGKSL
jgi:adenylate cyclase class 2